MDSKEEKPSRVYWREEKLEGEDKSEYERIVDAAVPHVRTGKSLIAAFKLAQSVLPADRQRPLMQLQNVPAKLVKMLERAVEDSLGTEYSLPKEELQYPSHVLEALAYKRTHTCPLPPSRDDVLAEWLTGLGVKIALALLQEPSVGQVVRAALGELLPKPRSTFERVTQGSDAPSPEPTPAPTPAKKRKPVVLVVGPKPGHERDAYIRELGRGLELRFFEGHTEGRGSRKLADMAGGVDQAFVITSASDHEQIYALQKLEVPIINSNFGRSGTINMIVAWAVEKGISLA